MKKMKNVPKHLSNTPRDYALDAFDKIYIKKYREDKKTKNRRSRDYLYYICEVSPEVSPNKAKSC